MAAGVADALDQVGAQFVGDGAQFGHIELAQVGGGFDAGQERIAGGIATHGVVHDPILAPGYFLRRPTSPPAFPVSAGSGGWSGTSSAQPLARLALTTSTTPGRGTPPRPE